MVRFKKNAFYELVILCFVCTSVFADIDLSGEYWFSSLKADVTTNISCAQQGTVVIDGNNWTQQWDDNDGHHSFISTFTTSLQSNGSIDIAFASKTYNIAFNGDTMIHADTTADENNRLGIDLITRKNTGVTANDITGQYAHFTHWLGWDVRFDLAGWGNIDFFADGTADWNLTNDSGTTLSDTLNWTLDTTEPQIFTNTDSIQIGQGGLLITAASWYPGIASALDVYIKKTGQTVTLDDMAGNYQVRFLESGPGGVPYTCGRGTCSIDTSGNIWVDAYYSDGEHDVFSTTCSIGADNTFYIDGKLSGIVNPDGNLILLPEYQYQDSENRTSDDWIGGIFLIKNFTIPTETLNGRFFWQGIKTLYPTGVGYGITIRVNVPGIVGCELKGPNMADYTAAVWDDGLENWKWEVLSLSLTDLQQISLGTWQLKMTLLDSSETVYEFAISGGLDDNDFLPLPVILEPAHTASNVIAEHYTFTWNPNGDQSGADDMYVEIGGDTFNYFSNTIDHSATQWYPGWLELGPAYCKVGYVDYRDDMINTPLLVSGSQVNWDVFTASNISGDKNYFYVKYSLDMVKDGQIDSLDLVQFCSHWAESLPSEANFDDTGLVELEDFSIFAQHWQNDVDDLTEHIYNIEISVDLDYESPSDSTDLKYEFEVNIQTDDTVNGIEFTTPAGNTFEIPNTITYDWMDIDVGREFHEETGHYEWYYAPGFDSAQSLLDYGDGLYTFTIYFAGGRQQQTTAWFGIPGTNDPIPQPTQEPIITSFNHNDTLTSPISVAWQPCTDSAADIIWLGISNSQTQHEQEFLLGVEETQLNEAMTLDPGEYEAEIDFGVWYQTQNSDGIALHIGKYSESDYRFTVTEAADEPDITWVSINDPGVSGHEGFNGEMSKYETTNAQYCTFLNSALSAGLIIVDNNIVYAATDASQSQPYCVIHALNSSSQIVYSGGIFSVRSRDGYDMANHPMVCVSWYGATAFCDYYGYRLPTEWEWEAVADYDGSYTYGCGTTIDNSKANFGNANPLGFSSYPYTTPVGYYGAFGYGLADTAGNVWEWTDSIIIGNYPVLHGGGWNNSNNYCTVPYRNNLTASTMLNFTGFRACR